MWRLIGLLPLDQPAVEAARQQVLGFARTIYHEGPEPELRQLYERLQLGAVVLELIPPEGGVVARVDRLAAAVHPLPYSDPALFDQDDLASLGRAVIGRHNGSC